MLNGKEVRMIATSKPDSAVETTRDHSGTKIKVRLSKKGALQGASIGMTVGKRFGANGVVVGCVVGGIAGAILS
ncbi:hypothetical protein EA58_17980 [Photobacterium galatheae]|uniref:Glycine zipper domain-containing protein n=2 Tax=Photobacterium galatheae TaxID=1654360 RepID=A0A066RSB1_9GAMM|nr:hypothetical protein EA58_17980 [Photobacterium galatheae]